MFKTSQPQGLSGLEVIQLFYPKQARLDTSAVGCLIGKQDRSIRNDICRGKFPIHHFKNGHSKAAKIWFDVRDVAAYLDAQRDKPQRGRPTKAQRMQIAVQQKGGV
jgi:hypothetical protein